MGLRIFIFLMTFCGGLWILIHTLNWVSWIGKSQWAESKMGSGGTYTMWKIIAIIMMIFGLVSLFGWVQLVPQTQTFEQQESSPSF